MFNKISFIKAAGVVLFGLFLAVAVTLPSSVDAAISVDFSQCANNDSPTPAGKCNWIGSILQASNSDYFEGMSVPQRILYRNVETNGPHTISFTYQYTKGGIHAYDFLATVDPSATPDFVQGVTGGSYTPGITDLSPCEDLSGPDLTACTSLISTTPTYVPIPLDFFNSKDSSPVPGSGSPQSTKETNFGISFPGGRNLTVYSGGGTTPFSGYLISALVHDPVGADTDTGDSDVEVTLNFTSAGCSNTSPCKYLIFFGGHLAVSGSNNSSDSNWGVGVGSSNISGGPYHIKGLKFDGGGGSLDNQIQGSSVLVPNNASITIIKDTVPNGPQNFSFSTTGTGLSSFSLDDDADGTLPNTQVFSGLAPGAYTVAETAQAGFDLTAITCVDPTTNTTVNLGTRTATINLAASESVTCTFVNTEQGTIIVEKQTSPDASPGSFTFTGDAAGTISDGGQIMVGNLVPGTYTSVESDPAPTFALTNISCDDGNSSGNVGTRTATFNLEAGETVKCTFTNTLQTGHIIVDKVTVPASDPQSFSFTTTGSGYSGFSLTDAATPDDQTLNAGAYSVSETVPAGWSSDGGVCVSSLGDPETPGSLELDAGETITCTFTNTKLGKILVDKVTNPSGSGQGFEFDPSYSGTNFFLTDAAAINDSGFLTPSTYSVSEVNVPAGWSLTSATCSDGSPVGAIVLAAGETVTCTFTNTQNATIIVKKDMIGGTGTFSYTGTPSGSISTDLGTIQASVAPGQYTSTETVPAGWNLDSIVCDDANSSGSVGSATATFNAEAGETVICTFTNTKQPTLTVNKVIVPSDDNGLFNLQIDGSTAGTGADAGNGGTTGAVIVSIGAHTVGEIAGTGTTLSDYTSAIGGDCASDGTVSLVAGENKTCTITNTKKGHIIVDKVTDPSGDTQSFGFVADFGNFSLTDAAAPHDSGALVLGTYSVSETVPTGWDLTSATCDDGSNPNSIGLSAGETVTCTFNNQKDANIIIVKQTLPDGDLAVFDFNLSYGDGDADLSDGQSDDSGDLDPGTYIVSETSLAGWDLTSATCSDGSSPTSIGLSAGETVTCTFTNTKRAHIIIQKNAIPDDSQVFAFNNDFGNGNPVSFNLTDDATPGLPSYDAEVLPGTYAVSEAAVAGWESPESASCSDGSPVGAIAVSPGETVTCTFVNEKLATIILVKNTIGGNGTFDFAMTGSGLPAGTQLTTVAGTDSETFNNLDPDNEYSIEETPIPAGWDLTSAVCSGTNAPGEITPNAGETVTCTFTDTARGKIIVEKQTLPDGSGQAFDFTSNYDGDGFSLTDGAQNDAGFLVPGSYSVAETGEAGWDLTSATCNDDDSSDPASLTLDPGETITCVFTNTQRGHLIVQKTTDPAGDQTVFDITASGTGSITGGGAGTVTDALDKDYEVTPGTYSVAEAPETGWDEISNSCSGVVVDPGETETCLITNQQDAFIIVEKQTDPNGDPADFDFTASYDGDGFILSDGETDNSGDLAPGTYSVSENAESGWDLTGVTCTSSLGGSETNTAIDLTAGETVTCVFTNQKDANIVAQKQTDPDGDSQVFDFTASYDGDGFSLSDGQSNDSGDLDPGTYSVSETIPSGWDLESATCSDGSNPASIGLSAGETVTCTFTNEKDAFIIVEKQTDPDGDQTSFEFDSSYGANFFLSDNEQDNSGDLDPGTYSVTELTPAGWDLTGTVCASSKGDSETAGSISLQAGETVTCVFTNQKDANIVVVKQTDPEGDLQLFTFTPSWGSVFDIADNGSNNSGDLDPGTYSVSETVPSGWDLTSATCDDGSLVSAIDLAAGETVTCTFNNQKDANIIVQKQTLPDGDPALFDFNASWDSGDAPDFQLADNGSNDSGDLDPGTYSVSEIVPAGWDLVGASCASSLGGSEDESAIALTAGETVTCTFENTKRGHITIEKQTLPDGSAADFVFTGDVAGTLSDGETESEEVAPGTYTSTETVLSGWDLTSIVCSDADSSGVIGTGVATFNVDPGEDVTCTFTNTQRGHIIVDKVTNPSADPQSFTFTTTGAGYAGFSLADADTPNDQEVIPGGYSVAESALAGWDSDGGICDKDETPASLNVEPGETVTCAFTNTKKATLTIVKDADPNDAQDFVFTRSFGANFTLDDDSGVQDAPDPNQWQNSQTFTVSAGGYTVTETIPNQYWKLDSIACSDGATVVIDLISGSVAITLAPGEEVTCTFQNDKITPTRTQGFWQTHYTYTNQIFNNPPNVLNGFSANSMLIGDGVFHKGPVDMIGKVFGAFWSNIAKKTTGQQRTALEKARMQLLQQLVAAKLNCAAFGCTAGVQAMIAGADTAFAGSNISAILTAAGQMDVYNNSGDTIIIGNAGKADPKTAKSGADYLFWNTP